MHKSDRWPIHAPTAWLRAELPRGEEPRDSIPSSAQVHT